MQGEEGRQALREVVANGEFFLIILPDGTRLVHPIMAGERHPLNFGREVSSPLLHVPLPCFSHSTSMTVSVPRTSVRQALTTDESQEG